MLGFFMSSIIISAFRVAVVACFVNCSMLNPLEGMNILFDQSESLQSDASLSTC